MTTGYRLPEEVIASYGTSLAETRKMMAELQTALKRKQQYPFLPAPVYLSQDELAEYGIELEEPMAEGWLMKITPGKDGGELTTSFITPDKWEIRGEDEYISPEGKTYTRAELDALMAPPEVAPLEPYVPEAPRLDIAGMPREELAELYGEQEAYRWTWATQYELREALEYAEQDPEGFLTELLEVGRTEDTERLLKQMFGATEAEIGEIFGEITTEMPEIPEEGYTFTLTAPEEYAAEVPNTQDITIKPDYSVWVGDKREATYDPETQQFIPYIPLWKRILNSVGSALKKVGIPSAYSLTGTQLYIEQVFDYRELKRQVDSLPEGSPERQKLEDELQNTIGFSWGEIEEKFEAMPWWRQMLYELPTWLVIGAVTPAAGAIRARLLGKAAAGGKMAIPARAGAAALRPMAGMEAAQSRAIFRITNPILNKLNSRAVGAALDKALAKQGISLSPQLRNSLVNIYRTNLDDALTTELTRILTEQGIYLTDAQINAILAATARKIPVEWSADIIARELAKHVPVRYEMIGTVGATTAKTSTTELMNIITGVIGVAPTAMAPAVTGIPTGIVAAGIPTMITSAMKADLTKLGYGSLAIAKMTPAKAWEILTSRMPEVYKAIAPTVKPPIEVPTVPAISIPEKFQFNVTEIEARLKEITTLLETKGRLPTGMGTKSDLGIEEAILKTQKEIASMIAEAQGNKAMLAEYVSDALDKVWNEIGNRTLPYHAGEKLNLFPDMTIKQLDAMAITYDDFGKALKLGELYPSRPIIDQIQQLRSEIQIEVEAGQAGLRDMRGEEARIAREALVGLERELKTADTILKNFKQRPEWPDAMKLRQTIMAWSKYKGLPKTQLQRITHQISGRLNLRQVRQEQLVEILDAVKKARPKRIGTKTIITPKTERRIQSLREALTRNGQLDEANYKRILNELGLSTDRYASHYHYITESEGKALLRVMNEEAEVIGEQIRIAQALTRSPELKAQIDKLIGRISQKRGAIEINGELVKSPNPLQDMRYYVMSLQARTGAPFYDSWQTVNIRHLKARYDIGKYFERLTKLEGYKGIAGDDKALKRISDYIASRNKLGPKEPANITRAEIRIASEIEGILSEFKIKVRLAKFFEAYDLYPDDPVRMRQEVILDAPTRDLSKAIAIYESEGLDSLTEYLGTRDWGVIRSGYEPLSVVNPRMYLQKVKPQTFGKGHIRVRRGIEYPAQDRNILQRLNSYIKQMENLTALRAPVNRLLRVFNDSAYKLENPRAVGSILSRAVNELKGYMEEGGVLARLILRIYAQAMAAVFFDPFKWLRNKMQNLAFHPDRLRWFKPKVHFKLTGQDLVYFKAYVSQMRGFEQDYLMRQYKPMPGLGRITRLANRVSRYPWTDETNRMESYQMRKERVLEALTKYHRHKDIGRLINDAGLHDLEVIQQIEALGLLAQDVVSYPIEGLSNVSGEEAFARYLAREVTNNTHFMYERAQRAPAEHGPIGRIFGNLLTFPRSWAQRIIFQANKLKPGSGAGFRERLYAAKVVAGMIIVAYMVGEAFRRLTGKKYNAYDPLNIFSWTPGGLAVGAAVDIFTLLRNIGLAATGDEDALNRVTSDLPRVASITLPFYDLFIESLESATGTTNLDRYFLRKLRELIDANYKVREDAYQIERDWVSMIQHALFGGEVPELEVPENPEIQQIKEQYEDLLELYDAYGIESSAEYIEDEDERRESRRQLLRDNPEFADARRRLQFLQMGYWDDKALEEFKKTPWWTKYLVDIPFIGEIWKPKYVKPQTQLVNDYLEYGRLVDKYGANSAEAMLFRYEHPDLESLCELEDVFDWSELNLSEQDIERLRLIVKNRELIDLRDAYGDKHSEQYIKDDEERQKAYERLYQEHPGFLDDLRRIEAYGLDAPTDKIVSEYIEYMHIIDQFGANSAEAKLFKLDHPAMFSWGQLEDVKDWEDGSDWNRTLLEINARWREVDAKYDELKTDEAREAFLEKHPDYHKDRLRRDAWQQGYSEENIERYVQYSLLPQCGDWRERFLLDPANSSFYQEWLSPDIGQGHQQITPQKVSPEKRDLIYDEFKDLFEEWENVAGLTEDEAKAKRDKLLRDNPDFAEARIKVQAYDDGVPEKYIDNVVEYRQIPQAGYANERYLKEHPDFYRDVWLNKDVWDNDPKDFDRVPSVKVEWLLVKYDALPAGDSRLQLRCQNKEFDDWLVLVRGYTPCYGTYRCGEGEKPEEPTAWEEAAEAQAIQQWMEQMWPEWAK